MHVFIPYSVLRQVHSLFQSEFSTQWDIVLLLSISSILSLSDGNPLATYFLFLLFRSLLSFPLSSFSLVICLKKAVPRQGVTNPVSLPSLYSMWDIPLLLDSTQYFTLTASVHPIFSILLQAAHVKTLQVFLTYFPKGPNFSSKLQQTVMFHACQCRIWRVSLIWRRECWHENRKWKCVIYLSLWNMRKKEEKKKDEVKTL
jgi:hypothetical protein